MGRLTAVLCLAVGSFLTACSYMDPYHDRISCSDPATYCVWRR